MFETIKKIAAALIVIFIVAYIGMIIFFQSLHNPKTYRLGVLDDFLESVEEKYPYVKSSKVKELHGNVTIKLEYVGEGIDFDESIYDDFKVFFMDEETQVAIIEKQKGRIKERYFPIVIVEFIDITGMKTHYIKSPLRNEIFYVEENRSDIYKNWDGPIYDERDIQ